MSDQLRPGEYDPQRFVPIETMWTTDQGWFDEDCAPPKWRRRTLRCSLPYCNFPVDFGYHEIAAAEAGEITECSIHREMKAAA